MSPSSSACPSCNSRNCSLSKPSVVAPQPPRPLPFVALITPHPSFLSGCCAAHMRAASPAVIRLHSPAGSKLMVRAVVLILSAATSRRLAHFEVSPQITQSRGDLKRVSPSGHNPLARTVSNEGMVALRMSAVAIYIYRPVH